MAAKKIESKKPVPIKRHIKAYHIKPKYYGCTVGTIPPKFPERRGGGLFILDERLTQDELEYLYSVIGHEGIEYS